MNIRALYEIDYFPILIVSILSGIGILTLYSAADGNLSPWADKQFLRFLFGMFTLFIVALSDFKWWYRQSYLIYGVVLILLIFVELFGRVGMGAQRWIDLYIFHLQPSELMRVALILSLSRYLSQFSLFEIGRLSNLLPAFALVSIPALLVLRQPDLGTTMMCIFICIILLFLVGVRWWKFGVALAGVIAAVPFLWNMLHTYQKNRILIFINPDLDPLKAGYHVTQSKIAVGSGGIWGKGFLKGTQGHLNFLPEKQTDFIFTMFAEEFGLVGAIILLLLFISLIAYGYTAAWKCRWYYGKLVCLGITSMIFLYVFINMGMVMGIVPVVGIPLPFMSYGGTSMITLLLSLGLVLSASRTKRMS